MKASATAVATPAGAMYRVLVALAALCGLLIVSVVLVTEPAIRRNRAQLLSESVLTVLPGAVRSRSFGFREEAGLVAPAEPAAPLEAVHAGYDDSGRLVGVAIPGRAMGYADHIDALWGYDPARGVTTGFVVLASRETPGLGDRIGLDPHFLASVSGLELRLDAHGVSLRQDPVAVAQGSASAPWEFDAITGATISSKAVADLLRTSATVWLPRLGAHRQQLVTAPEPFDG